MCTLAGYLQPAKAAPEGNIDTPNGDNCEDLTSVYSLSPERSAITAQMPSRNFGVLSMAQADLIQKLNCAIPWSVLTLPT